jgi:hypothetical protein
VQTINDPKRKIVQIRRRAGVNDRSVNALGDDQKRGIIADDATDILVFVCFHLHPSEAFQSGVENEGDASVCI